jgi:hypothetical protein
VSPAATLLLPYFEINPAAGSENYLISITNVSDTPIVAHVGVWSDWSYPVLDFNIYLTGYDVQTVNLRDILVNGTLPRTASDGQDLGDTADPNDGISNQGVFSQDINFASCTGQLPPPALPASFIDHLQKSLTGQSSAILGNLCAGLTTATTSHNGYVTIDTVNNCTLRFPGDATAGRARHRRRAANFLWGDCFVNSARTSPRGTLFTPKRPRI